MKFNMCRYWLVLDRFRVLFEGVLEILDILFIDLGLLFWDKFNRDEIDKNFLDLDRFREVVDKLLVFMVIVWYGFWFFWWK